MSLQRFIKCIVGTEIFSPLLEQDELDSKKADCRLNWGMQEKPNVEAILPMLVNIYKDKTDIVTAKEFRKILIDMGLALEAENKANTKPHKQNH